MTHLPTMLAQPQPPHAADELRAQSFIPNHMLSVSRKKYWTTNSLSMKSKQEHAKLLGGSDNLQPYPQKSPFRLLPKLR
ncbi:hypothetical protein B0T17DRAFT_93656 [Bombardia bombarda]|uniref:Uncharacterized protein n=1 Tax=Bombardia bombarda TaxID=252184 RepID=A0AA39XMR5_9PEZI|nr:hypothetical protein B0T17DRAFT_93656 [Bombardia bombarda]